MPEAVVALGESKRLVGRLRFETDGRRQHSQFEYAPEWLDARDAFDLAPGLPLREGGHHFSGRNDVRSALPGCFGDAAPDSWGRALMTRALDAGLTEYDYLVLSDDQTRQGALRFLGEDMEPLSHLSPPVPRMIDLDRIRLLTQVFENNPGAAEEEARDLAGVAGSLGGARPKANVMGDGTLWIAKFTSVNDTRPVERVEVATLHLARRCGLNVADATLELKDSETPIALIRRFDRRDGTRIPYMSARTALEWESDDPGSYTDIADVIRQISSNSASDLRELWCRILFTILVSNSDDHLKNHAFIYSGGNRWRLSPAFDINPSPDRHRVLETAIIDGGPLDASLDIALEAAQFFDILADDAGAIAVEMASTISKFWRHALLDAGASVDEIKLFAPAFEHSETEKALALR